jgi:hypothetical protein
MSPVSRGRKGHKNSKQGREGRPMELVGGGVQPVEGQGSEVSRDITGDVSDEADISDDIGPGEVDTALSAMLGDARVVMADLAEATDPIEGEYRTATLLAVGYGNSADSAEIFARLFIDEAEQTATPGAAALLHCIAVLTPEPARTAATEAADRLAAAGVVAPAWVAELEAPVTAGEFVQWSEPDAGGSLVFGSFERAGRPEAFVLFVDDEDCGAANDLAPFYDDDTAEARRLAAEQASHDPQPLSAAEFRWQIEAALDARAVHDRQLLDMDLDAFEFDDEFDAEDVLAPEDELWDELDDSDLDAEDAVSDEVPHEITDVILRARLRTLPKLAKPAPVHVHTETL